MDKPRSNTTRRNSSVNLPCAGSNLLHVRSIRARHYGAILVGLLLVIPCASAAGTDVSRFGAIPNDGRDDRAAFQAALQAAARTDQVVVIDRAGTYDLGPADDQRERHALIVYPGLTLRTGHNVQATLRAMPPTDKTDAEWRRMLLCNTWRGQGKAKPIVIRGIHFDGQAKEQEGAWPFKRHERQHFDMILVGVNRWAKNATQPVLIEGCEFHNLPAAGVVAQKGCDLTIRDCTGSGFTPTGAITCTGGGGAKVRGYDLRFPDADYDQEPNDAGVDVLFEDCHFQNWDIKNSGEGDRFVGRRLTGRLLYIFNHGKIVFYDCEFRQRVRAGNRYTWRLHGDVVARGCTWIAEEDQTAGIWIHRDERNENRTILLDNCRFVASQGVVGAMGIYLNGAWPEKKTWLKVRGDSFFGPNLAKGISIAKGGNLSVYGAKFESKCAIQLMHVHNPPNYHRQWWHYAGRQITLAGGNEVYLRMTGHEANICEHLDVRLPPDRYVIEHIGNQGNLNTYAGRVIIEGTKPADKLQIAALPNDIYEGPQARWQCIWSDYRDTATWARLDDR